MTALLVFVGAAVGAVSRYLTDRFVRSRHDSVFPWGTLTVNVVGSFVLGCVAGTGPTWTALVGTGFCGGLTTYSTFSFETVRLLEDGRHRQALANVVVSLVAGVAAAAAGYLLTR
ncbi:CrcB protein [Saccharothrix tamanrassetensis]|uniref:Fluoride-specific ion channel FluC n=1 Tax=Saccharothrix tamanrassetensis TaxID=1051531 RepID=A0A841CP03_9PSEU|nr:fluoride efflux transporter CrcB [Saccharothrix tamanrassetensis]MBB5957868.1 CrcB protein [Saccharothrix tamanrassetensis]